LSNARTQGKEKLNYRIKKGDTLGKIAQLYNVRASDLRVWNDIPYGSRIRSGDDLTIWIPKAKGGQLAKGENLSDSGDKKLTANKQQDDPPPGAKKSESSMKKYTVKPGDNLGKIAKRFHVTPADIERWNTLRSSVIKVGQTLEIVAGEKNGTSPRHLTTTGQDTSQKKKMVSYRVRKGDTLYGIASAFGVSVNDLKSWNRIRGNRIFVGQELVINS